MKNRIHFLDNLRTFSIFMVVVVHAGLVYESALEGVWIVNDPIKNNNIALIRMYLDLFIMFSIFFVSGYFVYNSARNKEALKFIISKLKRIMLPWFLAVFTLIPAYKAIYLASRGLPQEIWYSYFHFFSREGGNPFSFADNPVMNWLWFLPVLFLFQLIYLLLYKLNIIDRFKINLNTAVATIFILGVVYAMSISLLNLTGWHHSFFLHFQNERILIYFMIFLLGSLCNRLQVFNTGKLKLKYYILSNIGLTVGLLVFTVLALNLFFNMIDPGRNFYFISSLVDRIFYYAFMMISMFSFLHVLLYSFHRYLNKSGKIVSILNRCSYDVYIIHLVVVGLLAWLMLPWNITPMIKFLILSFSAYLLSNIIVYFKNEIIAFILKLLNKNQAKMTLILFISFITFLQFSCTNNLADLALYNPPVNIEDGIQVGTLEVTHLDSQLILKAASKIERGKYGEVHSMLIFKDNKLVFEEYYEGHLFQWDGANYYGEELHWDKYMPHSMMSCTKSFVSAAIGIAVEKGFIKSVKESIFNYLPDHQHFKTNNREYITIEHLLTMSSGLAWDEWSALHGSSANDIDMLYFDCQDPVSCVLDRPWWAVPGEKFTYNGGGMVILGEILKNATNMNIDDFSMKYLFEPLGVESTFWQQYENGSYDAAGSLKLTSRDMLKFGVCYLNDGIWNGNKIISEEWVENSSTIYNNNVDINIPGEDSGKNGYAYSWWTSEFLHLGKELNMYRAGGWGGQEIMVFPELDMVLVFTGGNYSSKSKLYHLIEKYILPATEE